MATPPDRRIFVKRYIRRKKNDDYDKGCSYCKMTPVLVGLAGRTEHDQQHCYHHAPTVKPEAATAVVELLMMGLRTPETC